MNVTFIIRHPTAKGVFAAFGFSKDPSVGWFCKVQNHKSGCRTLADYDSITAGEPSSFQSALDVLVTHGFYTKEAVQEALQVVHLDEAKSGTRPSILRIYRLIDRLKKGAAK